MSVRAKRGLGWVPDLPDLRDKSYRRAQANQEQSRQEQKKKKRQKTSLEESNCDKPHTFSGWEKGAKAMASQLKRARAKGDLAFEKKLKRALADAFPADETAVKRGRLLSPLLSSPPQQLATRVDLRPFMSPIEDQDTIGSCTAQAVTGLVEYLQIATRAAYIDASRLFLYKATRNLLQWEGDTGAFLRETIKALRLFGVCPELYWPYEVDKYDNEPSTFCYAYASNYQALSYYRLDNLDEILCSISQGYPVAFGFTCYESMDGDETWDTGRIPYPSREEQSGGGHAVLAVGYYDQGYEWEDEPNDPDDGKGYLIIRNSWGTEWGKDGYGFLPYRYIQGHGDNEDQHEALSEDYWTMTQMELPDLGDTRAAPFLLAP